MTGIATYQFKVASITTVSLKHLLNQFGNKIIEVDARADLIFKSTRQNLDTLGIEASSNTHNAFIMKYNIKKHDKLTPTNIKKVLDVLERLKIEDAAVQRLAIEIKDKKLGKICREALSNVDDFIKNPKMPLIKRIPQDEDTFQISFFSDPCERDEELRKLVHKPLKLKFFILNMKELINQWQIKNLPAKYNQHLYLPARLKIIDIANWNWKANYLPESYLSSAPIVDYIKTNHLPEKFRCEKNFGMTKDNKIVLTKFGR